MVKVYEVLKISAKSWRVIQRCGDYFEILDMKFSTVQSAREYAQSLNSI